MTTTEHVPAAEPLQFRGRTDTPTTPALPVRRLAAIRRWFAQSPWSPRAAVAALAVAMVAVVVAAYLPFTATPSPQPASSPAAEFSADRALTQLRAVASETRPMGSAEHAAAIDTIRDRLDELGVESEVVEGVATRNDLNQVFAGRLRNVIGRIPGTDSTGGVLLLSHFDSLPTSPNANDGGLGVATVLETVRALMAGPRPVNDIVLWFGDADETTAMNALQLQQHAWFQDVRFGFAFEAPGVTGPSVLTFAGEGDPSVVPPLLSLGENEGLSLGNSAITGDNGLWLREALDAIPHPVVALPLNDIALGAAPDLAVSMWGTDLAGVSFNQVADSSGYHTDLDNPDRVSGASIQHSGDTALALARHFGAFDFTAADDAGGVVAFMIAPGKVATYPAAWTIPLALFTLAALITLVVIGKRRGLVTISGLAVGVAVTVAAVIAAMIVALVVTGTAAPAEHFARNPYGVGWRIILLAAAALTAVAAIFAFAGRLLKTPPRLLALTTGPLLVVTVFALLAGAGLPALSYVFLWPAVAGVALLAWRVLRPVAATSPWPAAAGLAAVAAVVAAVGVPVVYLLASAFSVAAPAFAAMVAVLVAVLGTVLVPHYRFLSGRHGWTAPTALAVIAAAAFVGLQLSAGYDEQRPHPNYIQYTLDADTGRATWLSSGTRPDEWTSQFFTGDYSQGRQAFSPGYFFDQEFDVIEATAPTVDLAAPQLTVLEDSTADGVRTMRLQLTSHRGAPAAHLDLTLPGDLVAASVEGEAIKVDPDRSQRRFPLAAYNLGDTGMALTISVRSTGPITGTLTDFTNGLPTIDGLTVRDRPPGYVPAAFDFRDPTAVRTSVEL